MVKSWKKPDAMLTKKESDRLLKRKTKKEPLEETNIVRREKFEVVKLPKQTNIVVDWVIPEIIEGVTALKRGFEVIDVEFKVVDQTDKRVLPPVKRVALPKPRRATVLEKNVMRHFGAVVAYSKKGFGVAPEFEVANASRRLGSLQGHMYSIK